MKIFKSCKLFVFSCIVYFKFSLPRDSIENRQTNFVAKLDKLSYSGYKLY
jgi:hypothetical protein